MPFRPSRSIRIMPACIALMTILSINAGCASTHVTMGEGTPWDLQNTSWMSVEVKASSNKQSEIGVRCLDAGQYREAAQNFEAALAKNPQDHRSEFGLSVACEMMGQREKARLHCDKAVQLDPGESEYRRFGSRLSDSADPSSAAARLATTSQ